jgi:exosortase B
MTTAAVQPAGRKALRWRADWVLVAAFAVLAVPTAARLADQSWSKESGAHGPIILATGAWLIWRQLPQLRRNAQPGHPVLTFALLAPALALYVFGRAYDFLTFEAGGLFVAGLAMLHAVWGLKVLARLWFPLLYLAFVIPPPSFVLDAVTAPLKAFVSMAATNVLSMLGLPIARVGVVIFISHYELLVEDACSGLNSLIGLTAISLFYIYVMRGTSWRYAAVLIAFVIPIAVIANIVRIMTLVLITYFFGDAAAQGFLHVGAGVLLFTIALLLIFLVDHLLVGASRRLRPRSQTPDATSPDRVTSKTLPD